MGQFGDKSRRRLAGLAGPQALGTGILGRGRQGLGDGDVAGQQLAQPGFSGQQCRLGRHQGFELGEPGIQLGILVRQGGTQAGKTGGRPGAAQHQALEAAQPAQEFAALEAAGGQRMLERRQQGQRCRLLGQQRRRQTQEDAGRRGGQRQAGRIIDLQLPASELGRHPPGQAAVRRHQGGGLAGLLQGLAQQDCDGAGFFQGRRAVQAFEARQRAFVRRRHPRPAGCRRGRLEGLGDEPQALSRGGRLMLGPGHHVGALDAQMREQSLEAELGVAGVVIKRLPGRLVEPLVEARQHHGAGRQAGDAVQEIGAGGNAAGRSGGDYRGLRRIVPPGPGAGLNQPVAVGRRVAGLFVRQHAGPGLGDDGQEIERQLPVLGQLGRYDVAERREFEPFGLHLVDQAGQLMGQTGGLGGIELAGIAGHDQPAQQQLAPEPRDRALAGRRLVPELLAFQQQFLGIDLADGLDDRQQQSLSGTLAQECLGQTATGPARGQQDGYLGEIERRTKAGQHAGRQHIDEGQSGGDVGDLGRHLLPGLRALPGRLRPRPGRPACRRASRRPGGGSQRGGAALPPGRKAG